MMKNKNKKLLLLIAVTFALSTAVMSADLSCGIVLNNNNLATNKIRGWPSYVAMGSVTTADESIGEALAKTPVDAIFKYAGENGAGDRGHISDLKAEQQTLAQARYIEMNNEDHHKVMPVFVVYTSEGNNGADISNDNNLKIHYINLMNYALYLENQRDYHHKYPASIILNPDFLGTLEQSKSHAMLKPTTKVDVNKMVDSALQYLKLPANHPVFEDNGRGYVQSINWIIHNFAPHVPFGWQENTWSVSSAHWIFSMQNNEIKDKVSQPVIDFINSFGVYQGPFKPDFIVFDRYERDDLYEGNSAWFYNHQNWQNYLTYVNQVSRGLGVPAILWQIPGGHLITKNDSSKLPINHVSTAPDFFFGDERCNLKNIHPAVLNSGIMKVDKHISVKQHLAEDPDSDWTKSNMNLAARNNVAAILWGGGLTTAVAPLGSNGDDHGWLADKIQDYYKNPTSTSLQL